MLMVDLYIVITLPLMGWTGRNNASSYGLVYQDFVGGCYHFTENIGAYAELGFGITTLQFGLTYRM